MVSSKKSSTESKTKQAGTSKPKPATKSKNQTNGRKSETNDSNAKTKNNNSSKKHSINGSAKEDDALVPSVSGSDSEEDVREDRVESTSKKANNLKSRKIKQNHGKQEVNGHDEEEEEEKIHKFPMHRIKMIMRDEDSDMRINHEALFLVNKASEMFLSQFCKDAYTFCAQDRKKALAYKHLSSVVCKRKRYDFLSDFVPEKLKLEDALKERERAETGRGQAS